MTNKEFEQWTATRAALKGILGVAESGLTLDRLALEVKAEVERLRAELFQANAKLHDALRTREAERG